MFATLYLAISCYLLLYLAISCYLAILLSCFWAHNNKEFTQPLGHCTMTWCSLAQEAKWPHATRSALSRVVKLSRRCLLRLRGPISEMLYSPSKKTVGYPRDSRMLCWSFNYPKYVCIYMTVTVKPRPIEGKHQINGTICLKHNQTWISLRCISKAWSSEIRQIPYCCQQYRLLYPNVS